jgi:hypothetical protein
MQNIRAWLTPRPSLQFKIRLANKLSYCCAGLSGCFLLTFVQSRRSLLSWNVARVIPVAVLIAHSPVRAMNVVFCFEVDRYPTPFFNRGGLGVVMTFYLSTNFVIPSRAACTRNRMYFFSSHFLTSKILTAPTRAPTAHAPIATPVPRHDRPTHMAAWRVAQVDKLLQRVSRVVDATVND